jgi:hypothetical protein
MESLVARPATTWGRAHLTIKFGSALITVTSSSGLIFRDRIAAGPPAPPQPMTTNFLFAPIATPPKFIYQKIPTDKKPSMPELVFSWFVVPLQSEVFAYLAQPCWFICNNNFIKMLFSFSVNIKLYDRKMNSARYPSPEEW